jgi:hypothetical protein
MLQKLLCRFDKSGQEKKDPWKNDTKAMHDDVMVTGLIAHINKAQRDEKIGAKSKVCHLFILTG